MCADAVFQGGDGAIVRACAVIMLAAGSSVAAADVIVTQNVLVQDGETLVINDNFEFQGSLTVEAGGLVLVDPGFEIRIGNTGSLVVEGEQDNLAEFRGSGGAWEGIRFNPSSTGAISGAAVTDFGLIGIEVGEADVSISGSFLGDSFGFVPPAGVRLVIRVLPGSTLDVDGCSFGPVRGADGNDGSADGSGTSGGSVRVIDAFDADRVTVTNSFFSQIRGGDGGTGGDGSTGSNGTPGSNGIDGLGTDGGDGNQAGNGSPGGNGGQGGSAEAVNLRGVAEVVITQNIIDRLTGGFGGDGGTGGRGGRGGNGGDGGSAPPFGDGGDGGNGGPGGTGGRGGNGGLGGSVVASIVGDDLGNLDPTGSVTIAHNTVYELTTRPGGEAGAQGPGGFGGSAGQGGSGGVFGGNGQDGSNGANGLSGSPGSFGGISEAIGVISNLDFNNPVVPAIHNNIVTANPAGGSLGVFTPAGTSVDVTSNVFSGFATLVVGGTGIGAGTIITMPPPFVNPLIGDFRPAAGSFLVDAGDNTRTPAGLKADFFDNPRFMDEAGTPNTGPVADFPVDFGAIERLGEVPPEPCLADTNGDGLVTPADFNAWIFAFNNQLPQCDQNGDGLCTPADFNAWIFNFNAGCD